jgi:hypothetical protein
MPSLSKPTVILHESLIAFVNEKITGENWKEVLSELRGIPARAEDWPLFRKTYQGLGITTPLYFEEGPIRGPEPLQKVQAELQIDLDWLADSARDVKPPLPLPEDPTDFASGMSAAMKTRIRSWAQTIKQEPSKDLWQLQDKLNGMNLIASMKVLVPSGSKNRLDSRLLLTDHVSFVPTIEDLRHWVYYRLGQLWADGLLPRIGRCQRLKCPKFFLAKTAKKKLYCSQQCAQSAQKSTAAKRTKDTRARRGAWESVRTDLERALQTQSLQGLERTFTKAQQSFAEAYRRQKGPGYEEGKRLLARAKKQLRQLR